MRQRLSRLTVRLALGLACLTAVVANAYAANLSFLQDSAMSEFNDEDIRLLSEAFNAVVADQKTPATRNWKNDVTGNHGELRTLGAYPGPKGESCKRLRVANHAAKKKVEGKSTYTVCKMPEGWQLVPSDYAPVPKQPKK